MEEEFPLGKTNQAKSFLANFKKDPNEKKLGEGTYGVVTRVHDIKRNKAVALKKIKLDQQDDEGVPSTTIREIAILLQLKHQNIVEQNLIKNVIILSLFDVKYLTQERKLYLVFEYVEYDLKKFLDQRHPLQPILIKQFMYQILQGLTFCHARRVLHRDLKPQNILVNANCVAKLADFGLSRIFPFPMPKFTKEIATLWYRAPELMLGDDQYGTGVDIWAVGCIMAECYTNKPLFMGDSQIDMLFKMMQAVGTPTDKLYVGLSKLPEFKLTFPKFQPMEIPQLVPQLVSDKLGQEVLSQMLQFNPAMRPEAKELLNHSWFDDVRSNYKH